MIQDVTPRLAKYFGLKETKGALIADIIIGSPAENYGLKRGDFILRYNGKEVKNAQNIWCASVLKSSWDTGSTIS